MCSVEIKSKEVFVLKTSRENDEIRENICSCAKESSALLHLAFFLNLVQFSIDINDIDQS